MTSGSKPTALAVAAVLLFSTMLARADTPEGIVDVPPGADRIEPMTVGEPAPFHGQLFDPQTALRWANWLSQYRLRLTQLEQYSKFRIDSESAYATKRIDVLTKSHELEVQWYRTQLSAQTKETERLQHELANPPFLKTPWFGFAAGVVAIGLSIGIGAGLVSAAR